MEQIFQKINWIDILILIVLVKSSYTGFQKGFGAEICRITGYISAVIVSIYYYEFISQFLSDYLPAIYPISNLVSFTGLYIIVLLLFKFITLLIEKVIKIEAFSALEKLGGLFFGLIRGGIVSSLLLITLLFTPIPYFEKSIKERAFSGKWVLRISPYLYEGVAKIFPNLKFGQRNSALLSIVGDKR